MSKDLKMDYDKLEAMALSSSVEDKSFQDPRVYELWALAKKAKMPPEELESLKVRCSLNYCLIFCNKVINLIEKVGISPSFNIVYQKELQHFEHRLQKHDYYTDRLRVSEEAVQRNYKDGEVPDKHTQLEQMARDYGRKVRHGSVYLCHLVSRCASQSMYWVSIAQWLEH